MSDARPWSREALEHGGFAGFVPFADLPTADVPEAPGVYVVVRTAAEPPRFADESPAGPYRGKSATVAPGALAKRWIDGPEVLYIGKVTAGASGRRGLRKRLEEFRRHGAGEPAGHWSGRSVWQLADAADLLVAWNATHEDPAVVEARMLGDFVGRYGALPFANLRR